ncbi:hypothetical protein BDK92_6891 [Micromonospora pisi]|uniref:Uncharacterized protein n=1 Tax=Micromonospora pisi TaxID=589240 RepID=A0A495JTW5_9ACTN|nr:hypothetical protein BDK92_6891 [Micromonospora pisi]
MGFSLAQIANYFRPADRRHPANGTKPAEHPLIMKLARGWGPG